MRDDDGLRYDVVYPRCAELGYATLTLVLWPAREV